MTFSLVFLLWVVTTTAAQTEVTDDGYAQTATKTATNPACGELSYYGPSGVISSPNYPGDYQNDIYCDYYVYASSGSPLSFVFKSFHVESNDLVTISCASDPYTPPQELSGHSLPEPVSLPSCSQARVNFVTDYTNVSSGFSVDYYVSAAGCGNTVHIGSNGYVNSPHWPDSYRYDENCSHIIWVRQQSKINITFHSFNLQDNCSCDWLEISCLDNSVYGLTRYCGNYNAHRVTINDCSQLFLRFHSDASSNYQGFNIEYSVYSNATCGNASYYGPSGVITSPNHPGNYSNSLFCDYDIYASTGSTLLFVFDSFSTQLYTDILKTSCPANPIYSGNYWSGDDLPYTTSFSECSQGLVQFRTDHSVVSSGFSLKYFVNEAGCGDMVHYPSNGYVNSPNWPNNYGYNQSCSNIIDAYGPSNFNLTFHFFRLQNCCSCDWLEISCSDDSNNVPTRYCGSYGPFSTYIYNCSQVLLWFHSDGSDNYPGFNIEYSVYTNADCGKIDYYGPNGIFTSPFFSYDEHVDCNYTIYGSTESSFAIVFRSFYTLSGQTVTISCATNSSFPPQQVSGYPLPQPVSIPWCSQGLIQLRSKGESTQFAVSLDYYVSDGGCGNTLHNEATGYVRSPNYPSYYGNNQDCLNIIWAPQPSTFSFYFALFQLPSDCSADKVEMRCLDNSGNEWYSFCGNYDFHDFYYYGCSQVLLWFHSDGSVNDQGFNIEYTFSTAADCGNTNFYGPNGVINTLNEYYTESIDCIYSIYGSTESSFAIIFTSFATDNNYYVTISCATNSSFLPQQFSGYSLPQPVSIPGCSQGLIQFKTEGPAEGSGFSLDYYVSDGGCGNTIYNESNGYVTSPNYPSYYGYNQDCLNIIWAPQPTNYYFNFALFQLTSDCSADTLEMRCLDNSGSGNEWYSFCGNYTSHEFPYNYCTEVLLWFHSDGSVNDQGFNIEYTSYPAAEEIKAENVTRDGKLKAAGHTHGNGALNPARNFPSNAESSKNVPSNGALNPARNVANNGKSNPARNVPSNGKLNPARNVPSNGALNPARNVANNGKSNPARSSPSNGKLNPSRNVPRNGKLNPGRNVPSNGKPM